MQHDPLADVFSVIKNAENIGKHDCKVKASNLTENILKVMKGHEYIGEFKKTDDNKSGIFKVHLKGMINDCNVIKPRFSVKKDEFIKWEKRFLPANSIGILLLTTNKGVIDHHKAKKEGVGGQLLGYVY
jgi:small subunit ribosomal protein S8